MEMVRISGQQGVPVIAVDGQVVIGFNQPRLRHLLSQQLRDVSHPRRAGDTRPQFGPKLGASIADAASQVHKRPGTWATGAYVGRVRPASAAERAGLREGDVITALGGQPVTGADDLHRLVPQMPTGRDVSLTFVRDGRERDTLVRF